MTFLVLTECVNNTFGENCTLFCDCITQNTIVPEQSCDPHSGLCRCLPSWEGERCDVNGTTCLGSPGGCMSEINNITSTPVSSSSKGKAGPRCAVGSASESRAKGPGFDTESGHILSFLLPLIQ